MILNTFAIIFESCQPTEQLSNSVAFLSNNEKNGAWSCHLGRFIIETSPKSGVLAHPTSSEQTAKQNILSPLCDPRRLD
jgi:hypothetical protein